MKKKRTITVLVLALVSGSVAAFSAVRYLEARPIPLISTSAEETRPVVVAARAVPLGQKLTAEDLKVIRWPVSAVPSGVASEITEVAGRSVLTGLIPLIPAGMRALSVKVDEVIGVAGFVTPQTRVDVILIHQLPGERESTSRVILQNIQALAANQQITESEDGQPVVSTVVTVLVTPEDAEKLALAASKGRIQMALRHSLDLESVETDGESESRLFRSGAPAAASPSRVRPRRTSARPPERIIEMYRGAVRTLITYP
jgi:pilus assembly protein CpaB